MHVDLTPGADSHVYPLKTRKKEAADTLINVQGPINLQVPTPTCTGQTLEKGRLEACGFTSR